MNQITKEKLTNLKRQFNLLGMNYIDSNDRIIINYVAKSLEEIKTGAYTGTYIVDSSIKPHKKAIHGGLEYIKQLGDDPFTIAKETISHVPFKLYNREPYKYKCYITFRIDTETNKINKNSGQLVEIQCPATIDEMAPIFFGHEYVHSIKDTQYEEYIDAPVFGDLIPILYELIVAHNNPEFQNSIYKFRLQALKGECQVYQDAIKHYNSKKNKDLYKVSATRSGQYLNSFYYAIILFNIYKSNPRLILESINKVLKQEMTTREMLENLGLLHQEHNAVYDQEFALIKGILK